MRVLGTAGHVDHGKSTLVLALTGIDPDRLQEEKDRQMTIDLGFAWMTLPESGEVGIIDVPGHRDFIENMLAGVGGIDAAMLVIAADEGVMPQTREHFAILNLLEVPRGVIALTKIDLIEDEAWLTMVSEEIKQLTGNTSLANWPIVPISAKEKRGLGELREKLDQILSTTMARLDIGAPRLGIDRVFSIAGFGTVVTGTLSDGAFEVGEEIEILPRAFSGRIRGLQTHKNSVEIAIPGGRTAINISGLEVSQIQRGDVVVLPNSHQPTTMLDVHYRHLHDNELSVKHDQVVKFYISASQRSARIRLLGTDEIKPGEEGWIQLILDQPVVAMRGDHFILRRPSPGLTLGGGVIADPHPSRRHRRFTSDVVEKLENLIRGGPAEILAQSLRLLGPAKFEDILKHANLYEDQISGALAQLGDQGAIIFLGNIQSDPDASDIAIHVDAWNVLSEKILKTLGGYHTKFPLRFGMSREELKSRLGLGTTIYNHVLLHMASHNTIDLNKSIVNVAEFQPTLTSGLRKEEAAMLNKFNSEPMRPPSVKQSIEQIGEELYNYLLASDQLIQVSTEVVFARAAYEIMLDEVQQFLKKNDSITVAELRDAVGTSRKYALAFMEHLDSIGITQREGDSRKLA